MEGLVKVIRGFGGTEGCLPHLGGLVIAPRGHNRQSPEVLTDARNWCRFYLILSPPQSTLAIVPPLLLLSTLCWAFHQQNCMPFEYFWFLLLRSGLANVFNSTMATVLYNYYCMLSLLWLIFIVELTITGLWSRNDINTFEVLRILIILSIRYGASQIECAC